SLSIEVLTRAELEMRKEEILTKMRQGTIFIYPTDTIYGIGCVATNEEAVKKVRDIKQRPSSPLSIWVPNMKWISTNCVITPSAAEWLGKLPGPYTLILPLDTENALAPNVTNKNSIGIRLPAHWFHEFVQELGIPLITTSANITGHQFMTSLENLDSDVEKHVELMIYEGPKEARPSKIVHVDREEVLER
ncbi:TPA: threonylcarbamoyl-AMP synthase, partial [Candidatus Woesearchaeota archaeon]|nr:threonylcarbamoyl-AMP synthase [Candidatus Woesearchaeota archaeon]